ncbi:MAG: AMP-binding protein, partial [Candidatus Eremiobacterota bacterium]
MREVILRLRDRHDRGIHFYTWRGEWQRHSYAELVAGAEGRAAGLTGRVALEMPTSKALVESLLAVWLAGGAVCCLPLPGRLSPAEHPRQTLLDRGRFDRVITERLPECGPLAEPAADPDGLALIQFSSGTTRVPRPVALTHRNLLTNVEAILDRLPGGASQHHVLSWLPLYHDMGLIGCVVTAL